jgi:hypothetical protein|tara:strand:+ start:933 stop:1511 length:579 start_codon:yes stop_codon:yes gene_type:complete
MAFFVGGKELDIWVDLGGGAQSSATTHVDFAWDSFRSDGYRIFKVYITDLWLTDGYKFEVAFLTANNAVPSIGMYGGAFAHGEADADVADYDVKWNNQARIPVSANQGSAALSGTYRGNFEFTVNTGDNAASGVPNYWWHGTMRLGSTLASHIAGGGTCTQNARYGIRMTTSGPTANHLLRMRYKVLGMKNA